MKFILKFEMNNSELLKVGCYVWYVLNIDRAFYRILRFIEKCHVEKAVRTDRGLHITVYFIRKYLSGIEIFVFVALRVASMNPIDRRSMGRCRRTID